jgi:hypothetical protein
MPRAPYSSRTGERGVYKLEKFLGQINHVWLRQTRGARPPIRKRFTYGGFPVESDSNEGKRVPTFARERVEHGAPGRRRHPISPSGRESWISQSELFAV